MTPEPPSMRRRVAVTFLAASIGAGLACAGDGRYAPPERTDDAAGREVLRRFAVAIDHARFEEAVALLSRRWRSRYSPERLARDFAAAGEPARDAARRVLSALDAGIRLERDGNTARLPTAQGRAAILVVEGHGWRVDALE